MPSVTKRDLSALRNLDAKGGQRDGESINKEHQLYTTGRFRIFGTEAELPTGSFVLMIWL